MAASWRIRGFDLDRRLGSGASGEVWRATVVTSGDRVALKRVPLSGSEQARRAVAEAAKLRVLDHPHLVRLHDLVLQRDCAVLVLDLADAGTLADLLSVRGRLTPGEVITAIAPVAAALAHVHAAGIVHGDVSPANILFTPGGVPLLADLGVSRLTGESADAESTPAYVDPLVARGGVPTSHSDVFMLGAVALHALTGAPLWTASTGDAALAQACSAGLGHVEGRLAVADLPPQMAGVLRRALTLEPGHRGTAADFALDLRHSGEPVAVELAAGRARLLGDTRTTGPKAAVEPEVAEASEVPEAPDATVAPGAPEVLEAPGVSAQAVTAGPPAATDPVPQPASVTHQRVVPPTRPGLPVPERSSPAVVSPSARQGTGGRHAATPVSRPGRRSEARARAAERARSLIAARSSPRVAGPPPASDARPHFTRPAAVAEREVLVGRPAPTSAVAKPRPALPAARRRVPTRAVAAAVTLVAALVAAVLLFTSSRGGTPAARAPGGAPASGRPAPMAAPSLPAPSLPAQSPVGRIAPSSGPHWANALRALDATRARAFATRDAALLNRVYVVGSLRTADAAALARLVPRGCGLRGVHTDYRSVSARTDGATAVLTARASLPASRLVCAGRVVRTAPAVAPTRLRITLVREAGGAVLIAAERTLA
ncbi:serine/threonine-protein kinase [Jatrophihabitans endophyticus]|uniref:serine/threonine-protein kinase n=1 Tax=Jatrophihabitans endophyticus TaxID=1206085 RepID=UPI001A0DB765|nr:serine/threonine-protein kinase [Jatrophihabitans endophyticus]MBE7186818.1 protein kinase [Jatrophihabitans endophyticus]